MSETGWAPHTVATEEYVDPAPVAALSALLDTGTPVRSGDPLPPLWHWAALPTWPASSVLGPDGHPARGDFLPPVALPRRMFAGGEVELLAPIAVGTTVRRESRVEAVTDKSGRSGPLTLVTVVTELFAGDRPALRERQDLVYRTAPAQATSAPQPATAAVPAPVGVPLSRTESGGWDLRTDPTLLMRFSAATANPHRIHYDWPYATVVEGYPGLVVHGPLLGIVLAETVRLEHPGRTPIRVRHRGSAPLFCGVDARVSHATDDTGALTAMLTTPDTTHTSLIVEFDRRDTDHA
ncbi:MaoC family dehydratase N-terminal domain-containing protein [Rhodococcus olei]|uniref:MaoC family dehydratase N-terminal domain-containing protein n=1 Tax=Rhodococcus olei TaxID=2161675 RepID=A0ABP8NZS0_9NOCA